MREEGRADRVRAEHDVDSWMSPWRTPVGAMKRVASTMSEPKRFSGSTLLVVSAIASAAAFAAGRSTSASSGSEIASEPPIATTTSTSLSTASPMTTEATTALPPGHPPVASGAATTMLPSTAPGASGASGAPARETSLAWKVPARWQVVPNPSSMRLATYRVGADAEMAVSQAGGAIDANVDRWIGQFGPDAKKTAKVTTKKVAGLDVTIVDVEGTFGGGMSPTGDTKDGWALLGVIVATPDMPHFFKLTGPAKTVKAARADVDELVSSLAMKDAPKK